MTFDALLVTTCILKIGLLLKVEYNTSPLIANPDPTLTPPFTEALAVGRE
ncbi:MAG: hypothetical protein LBJ14_06645 [Desulfarculales bacterium]|jgi:hypothetical protein|nr:hypothetical protein [Desulfarculales bacterium]